MQSDLRRFAIAGKSTILLKKDRDVRGDESDDTVVSHSGSTMNCRRTEDLMSMINACKDYDVIGVDDAMFFEDIYDFTEEMANVHNKHVIVSALVEDMNGDFFNEAIIRVVLGSENNGNLGVCSKCGSQEGKHSRPKKKNAFDGVDTNESYGGMDVYETLCRHCWYKVKLEEEGEEVMVEMMNIRNIMNIRKMRKEKIMNIRKKRCKDLKTREELIPDELIVFDD